MKQKDIVPLIFIVIFSGVISYFLSNAVISSPKNRQQEVEVVEAISADFPVTNEKPYTTIFNKEAVNPTQKIEIGNESNDKPFNESTQ